MHIDARQLENNSTIEGDICIIGAGTAGISIALDWINTPHKLILLEGGGFEYDNEVQDLYKGGTSGQPYYPLRASRLHYFGGTTGHWAGMCAPFDTIDFKKRRVQPTHYTLRHYDSADLEALQYGVNKAMMGRQIVGESFSIE